MKRYYCCYFDHRYLPRALAMIHSLRRFEPDAVVWILCLNETCFDVLRKLDDPGFRLVTLAQLEEGDQALSRARTSRSLVEYYFTCTPSLIRYVQKRVADNDLVTYVDGDLYFFGDPAPIYSELGTNAAAIIPHRFSEHLRHLEMYGVYNVGWLTIRNDARGRALADWWRERCNEWCYDTVEGDRFADQKYLERFVGVCSDTVVISHPGANVAPWNLARHKLSRHGEAIVVDAVAPLLFFHFHGMRMLGRNVYVAEHHRYGAPFNGFVRRELYRPYVNDVATQAAEVSHLLPPASAQLARKVSGRSGRLARAAGDLKRPGKNLLALLLGQFVVVINGRAI